MSGNKCRWKWLFFLLCLISFLCLRLVSSHFIFFFFLFQMILFLFIFMFLERWHGVISNRFDVDQKQREYVQMAIADHRQNKTHTESAVPDTPNYPTNISCVNWNQYYTNCTQLGPNPFQGTISFDNIGMAWVAIFLVISLEGWTDIMYYVQDAHSFWDWIYFVLLIVVSFVSFPFFCL